MTDKKLAILMGREYLITHFKDGKEKTILKTYDHNKAVILASGESCVHEYWPTRVLLAQHKTKEVHEVWKSERFPNVPIPDYDALVRRKKK